MIREGLQWGMAVNPNSLKNLKQGGSPHEWKPGQTGNPSGRGIVQGLARELFEANDGEKIKTLLEALYEQAIPHKIERVSNKGEVVATLVEGDTVATKILLERAYGKVTEEVEVTSNLTTAIAELLARSSQRTNEQPKQPA